jgi:hypothetical protein
MKDNAGVQDSFTTEKSESDKQEEIEAKKVVDKYDETHNSKEKTVIEESIEEEKPITQSIPKNESIS